MSTVVTFDHLTFPEPLSCISVSIQLFLAYNDAMCHMNGGRLESAIAALVGALKRLSLWRQLISAPQLSALDKFTDSAIGTHESSKRPLTSSEPPSAAKRLTASSAAAAAHSRSPSPPHGISRPSSSDAEIDLLVCASDVGAWAPAECADDLAALHMATQLVCMALAVLFQQTGRDRLVKRAMTPLRKFAAQVIGFFVLVCALPPCALAS